MCIPQKCPITTDQGMESLLRHRPDRMECTGASHHRRLLCQDLHSSCNIRRLFLQGLHLQGFHLQGLHLRCITSAGMSKRTPCRSTQVLTHQDIPIILAPASTPAMKKIEEGMVESDVEISTAMDVQCDSLLQVGRCSNFSAKALPNSSAE